MALRQPLGSLTMPSSKDEAGINTVLLMIAILIHVSSKVPQHELHELLKGLGSTTKADSIIGIGLDSCVIATRHQDIHLVQTTDFFYPLVDDPYVQGQIAAANVLSDLYAMGVAECDNVLMILACSLDMSAKQRHVVTPLLIKGFSDHCESAGTSVRGGQTVLNPWTIVGGVATSVCKPDEYIMPDKGREGDVIVLTKPLGTQPAVNAHQWLGTPSYDKIRDVIGEAETRHLYGMAMHSMARLNRNAAAMMRKYNAHGATDVTGFGILGHAQNLAEIQEDDVDLELERLPCLKGAQAVNSRFDFRLTRGLSAETSGGLLVLLDPQDAAPFCAELQGLDGVEAHVVGRVVKGHKSARLADNINFFDVETPAIDA